MSALIAAATATTALGVWAGGVVWTWHALQDYYAPRTTRIVDVPPLWVDLIRVPLAWPWLRWQLMRENRCDQAGFPIAAAVDHDLRTGADAGADVDELIDRHARASGITRISPPLRTAIHTRLTAMRRLDFPRH